MDSTQLPLKDIHLPDMVGWWPPAPGWWLILVIIPLLFWLGLRLYRHLSRNTALKSARKLLAEIKQDDTQDDFERLCRLSVLLRRVVISLAPRSEAASLTGPAWLEYLDRSLPGQPFSQGVGRQLIDAPYRNKETVAADLAALIRLCEDWLKAQAKRKR